MRVINKEESQPDFLKEWKRRFQNQNGRSAKYEDIWQYPEHSMLRDLLISEQYNLCCYCCNRIKKDESHIEHFIPRNNRAGNKKQLDYHNMFASCNGYIRGISTIDKEFCGHRKDNWYDKDYIISPLNSECESLFEFLPNGEIKPSSDSDNRARMTIEKIGLNSYALQKAREAVINEAYEDIGLFQNQIDFHIQQEELDYYLKPNAAGELPAFCDAVYYLLKSL